MFAVGHADGCVTFWAFSETDKPLLVRTITHEDVNVTDADALLTAGALDKSSGHKAWADVQMASARADREPVYKMSWASFPDQAALRLLMAMDNERVPVANATIEYAERGETILIVLGGQSSGEKPGLHMLQFPAYQPPVAKKGQNPATPSESMPLQERYAYRDSLAPTGSAYYPTRTAPEDFVLLPRSSPYYGLAHDPICLIVSLTPEKTLTNVDGAHAARGIEAFAFPPPRTGVIPPSPGRKTFVQPGEGEKIVQLTPAPMLRASSASSSNSNSSGWRLPWTSPTASPKPTGLRVPTPDSMTGPTSPGGRKRIQRRRQLRVPSSLWSGRLTVLGCEMCSVPTPTFKRLLSWSIEGASESLPRMPIYGGMAVPDLQSHGAPDVKVAKLESYRILITHHPDATIRFWDISPHLLLLPTPLRFEYPAALPHLTISLGEWLRLPELYHLPLAKVWETNPEKVRIKSVHLARESLECVITLVTGEIIVTKFGEAKKSRTNGDDVEELNGEGDDGYFPKVIAAGPQERHAWVEEVTEIGHLARWSEDGFKPVAIFTVKRGEPICCAVSDIGECFA